MLRGVSQGVGRSTWSSRSGEGGQVCTLAALALCPVGGLCTPLCEGSWCPACRVQGQQGQAPRALQRWHTRLLADGQQGLGAPTPP